MAPDPNHGFGMSTAPTAPTYPIARPLTWYALVHPEQASYESHLLSLGTCIDLREFCQYLNHVPEPGDVFDGKHAWKIASKHWGYGICVFEEATRPEWEHPNNEGGIDLVCRRSVAPAQLNDAWRSLLLALINGELEEATGVRVVCKYDRRGSPIHKLEVWCRRQQQPAELIDRLRVALCLDFEAVPRRIAADSKK